MQVSTPRFMYAYTIAVTAVQKLRITMANRLPLITYFMIACFYCKEKYPAGGIKRLYSSIDKCEG
jgi:hypothetical protein